MNWRSVLFTFGVALLIFASCVRAYASVNADEARIAIQAAESRVIACYNATADAENTGGNVTELITVLNEAGDLLSQAKAAYNMGEFDIAAGLASNCTGTLSGFADRAMILRNNAADERHFDFMINIVGSAVGAVMLVILSWILWIYLNKRYGKVGSVV